MRPTPTSSAGSLKQATPRPSVRSPGRRLQEKRTDMATITAETVKTLREQSGAGIMECKRALEETGGDIEKAAAILKERGQAAADKRSGRDANEGQVGSYIHMGGKIGVLIEVNCETDFVARTDEFQKLVRDLAMQVAGLRPLYPDRSSRSRPKRSRPRRPNSPIRRRWPASPIGTRPDPRGSAEEVVRRGRARGAAVPRSGHHGRAVDHCRDRQDRREYQGATLRPV
jgi:hypothetical protein